MPTSSITKDFKVKDYDAYLRLLEEIDKKTVTSHSRGWDCDNCKYSYEDETLDGYWQLYCIKKLDNKEGSAVFPYDCCDNFESK